MWTTDDGEIYGWWNAFCGVIRTKGYLLEQLVVEGAETGPKSNCFIVYATRISISASIRLWDMVSPNLKVGSVVEW